MEGSCASWGSHAFFQLYLLPAPTLHKCRAQMIKRLPSIAHTWSLCWVSPGALTASSIKDRQSSTLKPHPPKQSFGLARPHLTFVWLTRCRSPGEYLRTCDFKTNDFTPFTRPHRSKKLISAECDDTEIHSTQLWESHNCFC